MKRFKISKKITALFLSLFIAAGGLTGASYHKVNAAMDDGDKTGTIGNTPPSASLGISKVKKADVNIIYGADNNYNQADLANSVKANITSQLIGSGIDANVNISSLNSSQTSTPPKPTDFAYTGSVQTFTAPYAGQYNLETWGAQGGGLNSAGGFGGYSTGVVSLTAGQKIYVYVGGQGKGSGWETDMSGGWNGGGHGGSMFGAGGGGGTDIRTVQGSLTSRIIVAGGGGGSFSTYYNGDGGGTAGIDSTNIYDGGGPKYYGGKGGTQASGGAGGIITNPPSSWCYSANGQAGTLGKGGDSPLAYVTGSNAGGYAGGGGGGYYGGGSGGDSSYNGGASGGGGSGYVGTLSNAQTLAGNTLFKSPSGDWEPGQTGNGYARITYIPAPSYSFNASSLNERQNAAHFIIDLSSAGLNAFNTVQNIAAFENNKDYFIGATSSDGQSKVNTLIQLLDNRGKYINNTDLTTSLQNSESYIMSILNQDQGNSNIFLIGDEINYNSTYSDYENDPKMNELWSYTQDDQHLNYDNANVNCSSTGDIPLDNNTGIEPFADGSWTNQKVTSFDKPGKYTISLKVQDNPTATSSNPTGDPNFADYNQWSQPVTATININRKPIAVLTAYATANASTGKFDITEDDGSQSYDLDHQLTPVTLSNGITANKGIVSKSLQWKEITQGVTDTWHNGAIPSPQAPNKDFIVKLSVTDVEGEQSDDLIKYVTTQNQNLPPIAQFTENETSMPIDQLAGNTAPSGDYANDRKDVIFTDKSYDPNGDSIRETWTVKDSSGATIYTGNTMPTASTFYGKPLGTYSITLVCDDGPTPKTGVPLTSNPYTQQLTLVPINHKPMAHFKITDKSTNTLYSSASTIDPTNFSISDDSTDPDNDLIAQRDWVVEDMSGNIVQDSGNNPPDVSQLDGTYKIGLAVEDNPKVPPALWSDVYFQTVTFQSLKVSAQIVPYDDQTFTGLPTLQKGQKAILKIYTTGYVDKLNITFPPELQALDSSLSRTMNITPQATAETDITFNVPRGADEKQYTVNINATNSTINKTVGTTADFVVQGDILNGFRTTIIDTP